MLHVVDRHSNVNDNVVNAARALSGSRLRQDVFREIYRGKRRAKTADETAHRLSLTAKQVLMAGNDLRKAGLVEQTKLEGRVAYLKEDFLDQHKARILRLAKNPKARNVVPTKVRPATAPTTIRVKLSRPVRTKQVTIDDIASFAKVRKIKKLPSTRLAIPEKVFKEGIKSIIGETGDFKDNPAERFDVLSTRVVLKTARIATAFALKGPGKRGILRPADMGKNGDQIQKVFQSEAQLFLVQYWGQVDESVSQMMRTYASVRSMYTGDSVSWGIIDGRDSDRLVLAYPKAFKR